MPKKFKTILLSILLLGNTASVIYAQNNTILPFSVYKSTNDTITINTIIKSNDLFKAPNFFPNKNNPSDYYWVKIDFKEEINRLDTDSLWRLKFINFDYCSFFYQDTSGIKEKHIGQFDGSKNTGLPLYESGVSFKKSNLINNRYLYLKLKRVRYFDKVKYWKFSYTSDINERLTQNANNWKNLKNLIPTYIFAGICAIVFILTFCFYLYFKEKQYIFYATYVLLILIYISGPSLKIQELLFGDNSYLAFWFHQSLEIFITISYISFVLHYLKAKKEYPKLYLTIKYIRYFLILLLISDTTFILFKSFSLNIYAMRIHGTIIFPFGICGIIYLIRYKWDNLAYFIVTGSLCFMIGAFYHFFIGSNLILLTGLTLEIIIFTFGLTYKMHRTQQERLRFQEESYSNKTMALKAQINPHFIFNSLNSIQYLIISNNKVSSLKYLTKFSRLMRDIMERSMDSKSLLSDEIKIIEDYLELEALRFNNSFQFSISVAENLDTEAIEVPALLVQPFVENAILHGLLNKPGNDKLLEVRFRKEDTFVICEIEDNGIGRKAAAEKKSPLKASKKSRGIELTEKRLELLNQSQKNNIDIIDKTNEEGEAKGTLVILKISIE
ncbi:MAG: histidine kinase [Aequorivita antarctica]